MNRVFWVAACGSLGLVFAACERKPAASPAQGPAPEIAAPAVPTAPAAQPSPRAGAPMVPAPMTTPTVRSGEPAAPGTVFVGSLSFVKPEAWQQQPPASKMRLAEFVTPDGCTVVLFDDLGAVKPGEKPTDEMVKANIDRWTSQVHQADGTPATPIVAERTGGPLVLTTFESTGTYQDGMPGGAKTPRPSSMFRGVVIRTPDDLYFVRMTGSQTAMEAHKAGWDRMIETLRVD